MIGITAKMYAVELSILFLFSIVCVSAKCIIKKNKDTGQKSAFCRNQGLRTVPKNLPVDINRLDLSRNKLTTIRNGELARYKYLQDIFIRNNKLKHFKPNAFSGVASLKILVMSGNMLDVSAYPTNLFETVSNLSHLDIRQNMNSGSKSQIKYSPAFNKLTNLEEIDIDLVHYPNFGENFKGMMHLKVVRFDYCYIHSLTNITFKNFPQSVKELYMENCNKFITVEADALRFFPFLSILDLSNSQFHLIQTMVKLLYPLQNKTMQLIDFHHVTVNTITKYDYAVVLTQQMMQYISTICIETLDISDNNIVAVKDKSLLSFQYPKCFKKMILSANRFGIEQFAIDVLQFFWKMTNLKLFDFSYIPLQFQKPVFLQVHNDSSNNRVSSNSISVGYPPVVHTLTLPKQLCFLRLTHVMVDIIVGDINLINSSLYNLDLSFFESRSFPVFKVQGRNNLNKLDLSGISATLTIGKFPLLAHLEVLKMKYCELYKVIRTNESLFNWVPNLRELDISNNYIWYLKEKTFGDLHQLASLNLSHNMFQIAPDALAQFQNIAQLDLSYNLITALEENIRNWIDKQQQKITDFKLHLKGNAFICSCETTEFLTWIFVTKAKLDNNKNYTCRMSNGIVNSTVNVYDDYHHYFVNCHDKTWVKIGVSLLTSMSIILICISFVYNFRWRMIFFFHRRFRKLAEKGLKVNFTYDVYVSYSDDSASFVKGILAPKIERQWGLTMCCEDRDFGVGEPNADIRAVSIHRSRHIIFLVTPSFIEGEWSSFEIERAKYEKFSKDLQKIVVITKNISLNQIPVELAAIWKDICLIEWPTSNDDLEITWQKLRLWFF